MTTTAPTTAPVESSVPEAVDSTAWKCSLYLLIVLSLVVGFLGRADQRKKYIRWDLDMINNEILLWRLHMTARLLFVCSAGFLLIKLVYDSDNAGDEWRAFIFASGAMLVLATQVPLRDHDKWDLMRRAILAPSFAIEKLPMERKENAKAFKMLWRARPFKNKNVKKEAQNTRDEEQGLGDEGQEEDTEQEGPTEEMAGLPDEGDEEEQGDAEQQGPTEEMPAILVPIVPDAYRNFWGMWETRDNEDGPWIALSGNDANSRRIAPFHKVKVKAWAGYCVARPSELDWVQLQLLGLPDAWDDSVWRDWNQLLRVALMLLCARLLDEVALNVWNDPHLHVLKNVPSKPPAAEAAGVSDEMFQAFQKNELSVWHDANDADDTISNRTPSEQPDAPDEGATTTTAGDEKTNEPARFTNIFPIWNWWALEQPLCCFMLVQMWTKEDGGLIREAIDRQKRLSLEQETEYGPRREKFIHAAIARELKGVVFQLYKVKERDRRASELAASEPAAPRSARRTPIPPPSLRLGPWESEWY